MSPPTGAADGGDEERQASRPAARVGVGRLTRTVVLGALAAGAGIWWLGRAYEVESSRLLGYLLGSALFVAALVALAVGGGLALRLLRRRRGIVGFAKPSGRRPPSAD